MHLNASEHKTADRILRADNLPADRGGMAEAVIEAGERATNRKATVTAPVLAAAMGQMPYWAQGPGNWLDMLNALDAAFAQSEG